MKKKNIIYVVDKDKVNLRIIVHKIQRELDAKAYGFLTGEACVIAMEKRIPDLIVSDCNIDDDVHKMTSCQLVNNVKSAYPDVHIIMYSSVESIRMAVELMMAGANTVVPKQEFFFQKIVSSVRGELEKMRSQTSEKRGKFLILAFISAVLSVTLYLHFNNQDSLMLFMLSLLSVFGLIIFWRWYFNMDPDYDKHDSHYHHYS